MKWQHFTFLQAIKNTKIKIKFMCDHDSRKPE